MPQFMRRNLYVSGPPSAVTFQSTGTLTRTGTTAFGNFQNSAFTSLVQPSRDRVMICGIVMDQAITLLECILNGVAAPVYAQVVGASQSFAFCSMRLPDGDWPSTIASPSRAFTVYLNYSASLSGSNPRVSLWSATGLNSHVPVASGSSTTAADTVRSVDLATAPGGLVVAMATNNVTAGNSCTWSGDQTPTERSDLVQNTARYSSADISATNDDPLNTITATFAAISTTQISLLAAAFR